jgi:hypothetical protein
MTTVSRFALCGLFLLSRSSPALSQKTDDPVGMVRKMHSIAGRNALDCGHLLPEADPKASLKCARQAIKRKQAFVVRYDDDGIEGSLFTGFAGDGAGNVYWLHVDDYTCQDPHRFPEQCPYVVRCPSPVRIFYYLDMHRLPFGYDCVPRNEKKLN